jgi:hypothetical protein
MKLDNGVKEGACHRRRGVRMVEWEEVRCLGKLVHNSEDDGFPMDLGQLLDEVNHDVSPHHGGHRQWL